MPNKSKGIYCIEGLWEPANITDTTTVLPILELLHTRGTCRHIYHDCATTEELEFYLKRWCSKTVSEKFPILYLAFHGLEEKIFIGPKKTYGLHELAILLQQKCFGKIIYFGSCSTLNTKDDIIQNFLEETGALAVIGYKKEIDWLQSAACDMFVFDALQNDRLDSKGISRIHKSIVTNYGNLHKLLELRVVINQRIHFPRKRMQE